MFCVALMNRRVDGFQRSIGVVYSGPFRANTKLVTLVSSRIVTLLTSDERMPTSTRANQFYMPLANRAGDVREGQGDFKTISSRS